MLCDAMQAMQVDWVGITTVNTVPLPCDSHVLSISMSPIMTMAHRDPKRLDHGLGISLCTLSAAV